MNETIIRLVSELSNGNYGFTELLDKVGASRAVFNNALRRLERDKIIVKKEGNGKRVKYFLVSIPLLFSLVPTLHGKFQDFIGYLKSTKGDKVDKYYHTIDHSFKLYNATLFLELISSDRKVSNIKFDSIRNQIREDFGLSKHIETETWHEMRTKVELGIIDLISDMNRNECKLLLNLLAVKFYDEIKKVSLPEVMREEFKEEMVSKIEKIPYLTVLQSTSLWDPTKYLENDHFGQTKTPNDEMLTPSDVMESYFHPGAERNKSAMKKIINEISSLTLAEK